MSEAAAETIALEFFEALWPEVPDGAAILVWTLPNKKSYWHKTSAAAAACAVMLAAEFDVYTMVSLQPAKFGVKQRGDAKDTLALSGLWIEVDIKGPGHGEKDYPPTEQAALDILYHDDFPAPTIVIHSGGGLHAWWLFPEPWVYRDDAERASAASLAERWQGLYRRRAQQQGYTFDSTQDLARVLRVPGTWNRKLAPDLRPVRVLQTSDVRLNPQDFLDLLDEVDAIAKMSPPEAQQGKPGGKVVTFPSAGLASQAEITWALRAQAQVPDAELQKLARRFPNKFLSTWNGTRPDFAQYKTSNNEYEFALANLAAQAGWPDQAVVDLLVHHRRLRTGKGPKHISYYQRTLAKARSGAHIAPEPAARTAESSERAPASSAPAKATKASKHDSGNSERDFARERISDELGTQVKRLVKIGTDDPHYRLETSDGDVIFQGPEELTSQQTFRHRVAGALSKILPFHKNADWPKFLRHLMLLVVEEHADQDSELAGSTIQWLMRYLSDVAVLETWDASRHLKSADPVHTPHKDDGALWINATDFRTWVNKTLNESVSQKAMAIRLKLIGCETKARSIRKPRTNIWFWRLPVEDFDPADYPIKAADEYEAAEQGGTPDAPDTTYVV